MAITLLWMDDLDPNLRFASLSFHSYEIAYLFDVYDLNSQRIHIHFCICIFHYCMNESLRPISFNFFTCCSSFGAKVLIDDNPSYALECAEVGISVLLFDYDNSYPWSKSDLACSHPLVTKVHNWSEVEKALLLSVIPDTTIL